MSNVHILNGKRLNSWYGQQKLNIAINWFTDGVQAGIFVAERESWIKIKCKCIKQVTYYMYHKITENTLQS